MKTFEFWTKTGKEMHVHPITTYVWWLLRQEPPLIFLGTVGAALIVWKPRNAFALFSALWAFGLLAAYSLIGYKTPWLVLNFVVPLALISGYALQVIYDWGLGEIRLIIAVMLLAVAISGYKTVDLNFFNYDNDAQSYVYVYAHTRREMLALVDEIEKVAERTKRGTKTGDHYRVTGLLASAMVPARLHGGGLPRSDDLLNRTSDYRFRKSGSGGSGDLRRSLPTGTIQALTRPAVIPYVQV